MKRDEHMQETLCAPASGWMRGYGGGTYVIDFRDEENGDVVAPVGGVVTHIGAGGNRISICSRGGTTVSVGIGQMRPGRQNTAEGCHFYVQEGDSVRTGQRLMHAQLSRIRRLGGSSECVMTVGEQNGIKTAVESGGAVRAGVTPFLRVENLSGQNS